MARGTLRQLQWSGDRASLRYHLSEDEMMVIYRKYMVGRRGDIKITDGLRRYLTYLSPVQLGSIVSWKGTLGNAMIVEESIVSMLRHAALLEIKDTRILTALSMLVEEEELREAVLERLKKMVDGKKRIEELSKAIKAMKPEEIPF